MEKKRSSEIRYTDLNCVFEGIVIGSAIKLLRDIDDSYVEKKQLADERSVSREVERLSKVAEDLIKKEEHYIHEGALSKEIESISFSYIVMMKEITNKIIEEIKRDKINAEYAVMDVINAFSDKLKNLNDDYLKERIHDLHTIKNRFLAHLMEKNISDITSISNINKNDFYILVSDEIMPSDFFFIKKGIISGIIHGKGGKTSHIAIIARSLEIPTIVGAEKMIANIKDRDIIILDSYQGSVYVNPDISTLQEYKSKKKEKQKIYQDLIQKTKSQPAVTKDNRKIDILANLEIDSDTTKLSQYGAEGVGLYRTEFLFIENEESKVNLSLFMDEETQFQVYKRLTELTSPRVLTIRTLDIGRNHIKDEKLERNPFLGLRSIRFCLVNSSIFKTQLRAILRASHYGYVKIMLPMITNVDEILTVKTLLEDVKRELIIEGVFFDEDIELGVMIEVPSAALIIDLIAKEVDFIAIGTNDLLQYTMAVDRSSPDVSYLYNPFSISFFRLLHYVVKLLERQKKPFYICGEITSDPLFVLFLLGLGVQGLTTNIYDIPKIKDLLRHVSYVESKKIVRKLLRQNNDTEIKNTLQDFYQNQILEEG